MNKYISKAQYLRGHQCYKSLWLYIHRPSLIPDKKKHIHWGKKVDLLARELFPHGITIPFENNDYLKAVKETENLINKGATTIYDAVFEYAGAIVFVDILHKGRLGWEIFKIKSSGRTKLTHILELSIQYFVLTGNDLLIYRASVIHLNTRYIKKGDLNIYRLFTIKNVTSDVKAKQNRTKRKLKSMQTMLDGPCPEINIGKHCHSPYHCDLTGHCWAHIPENSVFDLKGKGVDKFKSYQKEIIKFSDLNLDDLNAKQRMQVEGELTGKVFINPEGIKKFLRTIRFPLYFLDFETFQPPIPLFYNTKPYEQSVFQYSLHCLMTPQSKLLHYEFIADPGVDQRSDLIKNLISQIVPNSCIVTYNMQFEKLMLKNLSVQFPQYKKELLSISRNIIDIMAPFQKKHYYTKEMKGSYSLKYVLPALVLDLDYKDLNISNGEEAMNAYTSLFFETDKDRVKKIKKDLLSYCKLDTLALVKLLEKLESLDL